MRWSAPTRGKGFTPNPGAAGERTDSLKAVNEKLRRSGKWKVPSEVVEDGLVGCLLLRDFIPVALQGRCVSWLTQKSTMKLRSSRRSQARSLYFVVFSAAFLLLALPGRAALLD